MMCLTTPSTAPLPISMSLFIGAVHFTNGTSMSHSLHRIASPYIRHRSDMPLPSKAWMSLVHCYLLHHSVTSPRIDAVAKSRNGVYAKEGVS